MTGCILFSFRSTYARGPFLVRSARFLFMNVCLLSSVTKTPPKKFLSVHRFVYLFFSSPTIYFNSLAWLRRIINSSSQRIFLLSYSGKQFLSCDCPRRTMLTVNCGDYCVAPVKNCNFYMLGAIKPCLNFFIYFFFFTRSFSAFIVFFF